MTYAHTSSNTSRSNPKQDSTHINYAGLTNENNNRRRKLMMNRRKSVMAASLAFAAASLASVGFATQASAQCAECSMYPDRDPFTQGLVTPAPGPAVAPNATSHRSVNGAHAEMRGHHKRYVRNSDQQHQ
jgi:hypothetical protein